MYRLTSDLEKYRNYILSDENKCDFNYKNQYDMLDGRSLKRNYKPCKFVMTEETEKEYPIADIMMSNIPLCSEKAKKVIEKICDEKDVEFLPCTLEGTHEKYYIFNILVTEDCIDYDSSKFQRFPSTGKIMFFEYIVFKKKISKNIFRIKDLKIGHYFVNENTKEILEKAGLKGINFDNSLFFEK